MKSKNQESDTKLNYSHLQLNHDITAIYPAGEESELKVTEEKKVGL